MMGVNENIVEITDQNFAETIEGSTGLTMVDFWARAMIEVGTKITANQFINQIEDAAKVPKKSGRSERALT